MRARHLGLRDHFDALDLVVVDEEPLVVPLGQYDHRVLLGSGLEASTADVATEFANMIVTQRGYQANTRIVTVTDSMLEELVNMKR